ncbi:hypothetical protein BOW19_11555 [Solemya velum gill symbiont]|nr:hypothetical protein BOW19_11555 [Solemya velum gill symbiont]
MLSLSLRGELQLPLFLEKVIALNICIFLTSVNHFINVFIPRLDNLSFAFKIAVVRLHLQKPISNNTEGEDNRGFDSFINYQ